MKEEGLSRPKMWHRPFRPKRVEKMRPSAPNQAWQIDMTSLMLSDLTPLYLVTIVDCYTREIVGWTLDRRCRASEWVSAVRQALDYRGLIDKAACQAAQLILRSDNGAQPCSKRFVEYLASVGIKGQYTGYNAPDDNAYIERLIRTLKEEEIWPNQYDTFFEAHQAIDRYIRWYNEGRIHSALDYQTPKEAYEQYIALKAA
jgi:putative transposase